MRYAIVIEKGKRNYSAYAPDVPGCAATGKTLAETKQQMQEALEFHFEGMLMHGEKIPDATSEGSNLTVDLAKIARKVQKQRRATSA
jgi:predicted RNase H-like HicB family nuclease